MQFLWHNYSFCLLSPRGHYTPKQWINYLAYTYILYTTPLGGAKYNNNEHTMVILSKKRLGKKNHPPWPYDLKIYVLIVLIHFREEASP